MTGLLLGLINILFVVLVLLLVGVIVQWILGILTVTIPDLVRKLYLAIVAVIALYMIVRLLLGLPSLSIIG